MHRATSTTPGPGASRRRAITSNVGPITAMGGELFDPESVEQTFVPAPVAPYPDGQVEEDLAAEDQFHLASCGGADRADHLAPLPDQDALLRLGLGPGVRDHGDQPVLSLLDRVHLYLDGVRQFVVRAVEDLLPDQLGEPDLERHVGLV